MRYVLVLTSLSLLLLGSCSGVERINNGAIQIKDNAQQSHQRFETINEEVQVTGLVNKELISSEAQAGAKEQETIIDYVNVILKTIPSVEDSVPWWANLLQWGFIALAIVGSFVLLWYLGLGYPIKAIMRSFASFIPSKKKEAAKLLVQSQDDSSPTTMREAIAVMRATDKEFNAAYKKAVKENAK